MYTVKDPQAFAGTPELGMGYHFGVEEGGEPVIVLNARFALTDDDLLRTERFAPLLQHGDSDSVPLFAPQRLIVPSDNVESFIKAFGRWLSNLRVYESRTKLHTSPAFTLTTTSAETFVRFSAFRNDRRVRPDGSLLPGTYATSERDAPFVPSGFAAVGRYALPNMMPAVHRFDIAAPIGTNGLVGTVAPAFGQAGGGVEIELTGGTPAGSVTYRTPPLPGS